MSLKGGFVSQDKMSREERSGMLGIDHQRGSRGRVEPGVNRVFLENSEELGFKGGDRGEV